MNAKYFLNTIVAASDVNGDGFGDLVVGAPRAAVPSDRPWVREAGRVHENCVGSVSVIHGGAMGIATAPARVLEGAVRDDEFGISVASAFGLRSSALDSWFASARDRAESPSVIR